MKLTEEQQEAVAARGNVKIEAVAGSGKTTTLVEYARRRPGKNILYLAFNRSVREHAQKVMFDNGLSHVSVQTAHSLAFGHMKNLRRFEVSRELKTLEIVGHLGLEQQTNDWLLAVTTAKHVQQCLSCFCNSHFLKLKDLNYPETLRDPEAKEFARAHIDFLLKQTRRLMELMYNNRIPYTHDFYLKLYHQRQPVLPFDYILFDEGQDASAVMLDIFLKQDGVKVIVGDKHQQIYGWRYAVNSLERVDFPSKKLTHSFRFDESIAKFARNVLELKRFIGREEKYVIQGAGGASSVKTKAVLARTNIGLIEEAIQVVDKQKAKLWFDGNVTAYAFSQDGASVYDVLALYEKKRKGIRSELVRKIGSFANLEAYAEEVSDNDLKLICRMVKTYESDLRGLLKQLQNAQTDDPRKADYMVSTVHKAKGLEYDHVRLADDFITKDKLTAILKKEELAEVRDGLNEEINVLYVAITRARKELKVPSELLPLASGG